MVKTDTDIFRCAGRGTVLFADKAVLFAVVAVWLVGAAAALIAFGAFRTGSSAVSLDYAVRCTEGFAVGAPLAIILCRLVAGRLWSRAMCAVTAALVSLVFVGIAVNMAGYLEVAGATWQHPGLEEYSDSANMYFLVGRYADGLGTYDGVSMGPVVFWSLFFRLFSPGLLAPLIFNAFCMAFSVTLCGVICARLVPSDSERKAAWVGTLLMAVIPSIPYYGAMFMKEAPLTLGFTLMALSLADLYKGRMRTAPLLGAALGALLLMALKPHMGYLTALGALVCLANARRGRLGSKVSARNGALAMLLLSFVIVAGGRAGRSGSDFMLLDASKAQDSAASMLHPEAVRGYGSMVGDYYSWSLPEKAIYLPVAAAAQYFPPFPWNYTRDTRLARFVPVAHISILWYLVGGMVLAWFALCFPSRRRSDGLRLWALFWLACYLAVAFMSAGSVARYYLPFMALCVPLAVDVCANVSRGGISKKKTSVCASVYAIMLAVGLTLAYNYLQ